MNTYNLNDIVRNELSSPDTIRPYLIGKIAGIRAASPELGNVQYYVMWANDSQAQGWWHESALRAASVISTEEQHKLDMVDISTMATRN